MTSNPSTEYLVKGDITGIQSFIFNVNSELAAQSLKGRSFFIKILLELGIKMIFDRLNLQSLDAQNAAKISTSGGNFILQLDLADTGLVDKVQGNLNKALQFTGLNIVLAYMPVGQDYGASLKELNQKIRERKHSLLLGDHSFFASFERAKTAGINDNQKWVSITHKLRNTTHFSILDGATANNDEITIVDDEIKLAGYTIKFGEEGIPLKNHLESLFPARPDFKTLADGGIVKKGKNTVTGGKSEKGWKGKGRNNQEPDYGQGIKKLGVLAMDVDNLGAELEDLDKPEALRKFDQELQEFFNQKLRSIINQSNFKDRIYVVTAGGDDSYFVGKWNVLLDLASVIRGKFREAFSERSLSISAALVIVDVKFPVVRFAKMADEAIKDAKYKYEDIKGNINLFGEVLDWDMLEKEIAKLRSEFSSQRPDLITSGLLTKARKTSLKIAQGDGIKLSDFWKLGYFMRNFKGKGKKILDDYSDCLAKATVETNPVKKKTYKLVFAVAARLAEFDKRKN